jgi:hypothetical protein
MALNLYLPSTIERNFVLAESFLLLLGGVRLEMGRVSLRNYLDISESNPRYHFKVLTKGSPLKYPLGFSQRLCPPL